MGGTPNLYTAKGLGRGRVELVGKDGQEKNFENDHSSARSEKVAGQAGN